MEVRMKKLIVALCAVFGLSVFAIQAEAGRCARVVQQRVVAVQQPLIVERFVAAPQKVRVQQNKVQRVVVQEQLAVVDPYAVPVNQILTVQDAHGRLSQVVASRNVFVPNRIRVRQRVAIVNNDRLFVVQNQRVRFVQRRGLLGRIADRIRGRRANRLQLRAQRLQVRSNLRAARIIGH